MTEIEQMLMELVASHKVMKANLEQHIEDENGLVEVVQSFREDIVDMKQSRAVDNAKLTISSKVGLFFLVPLWAAIIAFLIDHARS